MEKEIYCLQWKDDRLDGKANNLGLYSSIEDARDAISAWWHLNDFKPGYIRSWKQDSVTTIDYGSHYTFYYITKVDKESYGKVMFGVENL